MSGIDPPTETRGFARRLLRASAQYSAGQIVSMLTSILRVAVSARVLSQEAGGVWLGMQLVMSYGSNLHFGSAFGLFRSVPLLRAQGKTEDAEREKETSFAFISSVTLVATPLLALGSRNLSHLSTKEAISSAVLVALGLYRAYYNTILKAESRFKELAQAYVVSAVGAVGGLVLIYLYQLDGLIFATGAQMVIEIAYCARMTGTPRLRMSRAILWAQLRVGFITLLTSLGTLLLTTIDRTVMLQRLGTGPTGMYYVGANVMILMPIVVGLPAAVLTPQFFERVGRGEDVLPLVRTPVRLASDVFAALVALGSITIGPTVTLLWPHLVEGVPAAQAALFATYPLVLAGLVVNVYYAHDRQGVHVAVLLVTAALGYALAHLGVSMTHAIVGAAVGAGAAIYIYFPLVTIGAFWVLDQAREGFKLAVGTIPPIAYAGTLTLCVENGLKRTSLAFLHRSLLGFLIVLAGVAPLLLRARRDLRRRL